MSIEADGYPYWTSDELKVLAEQAEKAYIAFYKTEMQPRFREVEERCAGELFRLFEASDWLRDLVADPRYFSRKGNKRYLEAARYLTDPVISADTLKIVATPGEEAATVAEFLDSARFPWLDSGTEVDAESTDVRRAVQITSKLWASQRAATEWRNTQSSLQEHGVRKILGETGLEFVEPQVIRQRILEKGDDAKQGLMPDNYQEVLERGEFSREMRLAGAKCDVPVRLQDGRLLPIECKVSGTALNSIKRLNRETGGKHDLWRSKFGHGLLTATVIGGIFGDASLQTAQAAGILIFFDYDLRPLANFLESGAVPRIR